MICKCGNELEEDIVDDNNVMIKVFLCNKCGRNYNDKMELINKYKDRLEK